MTQDVQAVSRVLNFHADVRTKPGRKRHAGHSAVPRTRNGVRLFGSICMQT